MKDCTLKVTCNGSGAGSATSTQSFQGWLVALDYIPGTIDTGATITVTDETNDGASITIYLKASAGTSNVRKYPRTLQQLDTDGSDLTTHTFPLFVGNPKLAVSSGGAGGIGSVKLYFLDLTDD